MIKFRLTCPKQDFIDYLKSITAEGSAFFYNSPFRVFYLISPERKKSFLGYIFNEEFDITKKAFLRQGLHILNGAVKEENGKSMLYVKVIFSKLLLVFYTLWFIILFGISIYFLIEKNYFEFIALMIFGLFAFLLLYVQSHFLRKSEINFFRKKLGHLIEEV
jgi:hypothetical protein